MAQLLTASGSAAASSGTPASITSKKSWRIGASGTASAYGRASAISRILPQGGLTDLGIWATGQPDTVMSRDLGRQVGADTTAARGWLAASAPVAYSPTGGTPLWETAVYAGVGIKWASVPNAQKHAWHQVQMEAAATGNRLSWDATSWEGRRTYTAQANGQYCTVDTSTDTALSGTKCGKIVYAGAPAGTWGYWINPTPPTGMTPCLPGERISGSVSIRMNRAAWWTAGLQFYDANYAQINGYWYNAYRQHPGGNAWDTSFVFDLPAPANTAYVAVVPEISINSTPVATDAIAPVGEIVYCDMHRIWSRPYNLANTPTPYQPPRKITIDVKANRVNLVNNPSLDKDTKGWGVFGAGTAPTVLARDAVQGRTRPGALKFSVPATVGSYGGVSSIIGVGLLTSWSTSNVGGFGWNPSTTYTVSAYVKLGPKCPPVTLYVGYTPIAGVTSTTAALNEHPELIEGDWIRLWATIVTSSSDDGLISASLGMQTSAITAGGVGVSFWTDDVMSEEGDQLGEYFDGASPGSDYLWAGIPGYSSSHYYRGYRSAAYRLRDIVRSVVPHGTQYELRYARPPV